MDDFIFKEEDLHLDLRPRRKRRFRNNKPTKKITSYVSPYYNIRIYLLTWNTNSRAPPEHFETAFPKGYDVYAIGLQEMGNDWLASLDNLFQSYNVVRIKARRLQGIQTVVYVRRELLQFVSHVESETTRTGLGGMWGNKGSASIRFDLYGINLIIVNCHLAAHMEKVTERLQDVNSILDSQHFKDKEVNNILDHDYVFWMGDLNFRIDNTLYENALQLIEKKDYAKLLEKDQLKSVMADGLFLPGFKESPITFPPTYKFDVGTDTYDTSPKKRVPAYCDRILYFHHDATYGRKDVLSITPVEYSYHPVYTDSDHKPVFCVLDFNGMYHPPAAPVVFNKVKRAATLKAPFMIKFHCKGMKHASGDWIGIYKSDFLHFDQHVGYQWVPNHSILGTLTVTIPVQTLKKLGKVKYFVACYISKQYNFCGMSEPFELVC